MSVGSLAKFMRAGPARGPVTWGRADIDGAPFRGPFPQASEEELESRLVRVADSKNRIFNIHDPEENAAYLEVLDKVTNGWAQLLKPVEVLRSVVKHTDRDTGDVTTSTLLKMYVEWCEYYMEDGQPNESQRPYQGRLNG